MVRQRRKSRLLVIIQNSLLEQFAADVSDRTADELVGVNRNTAILYFHKIEKSSPSIHFVRQRRRFRAACQEPMTIRLSSPFNPNASGHVPRKSASS
jgi:hypothetical protein